MIERCVTGALLGQPWRFEAVVMAVWLAHKKRLDQV
jgi:hypothetical protein